MFYFLIPSSKLKIYICLDPIDFHFMDKNNLIKMIFFRV